jgi:nucleoside-diphosphate-sugar epimerase
MAEHLTEAEPARAAIAVTGVGGLVGGALRRDLTALGFEVAALTPRPDVAETIFLENGRPGRPLPRPLQGIIHCGGLVGGAYSREEYLEANVRHTKELLLWSEENGVEHFIYISSGGVYGPAEGWLGEEALLRPEGFYAESKALAEEAVLKAALPIVSVIRLYFPIGPLGKRHFFEALNKRVLTGEVFFNDAPGRPFLSPIDLHDLAPVLAAIAREKISGIFNLSANQALSVKEATEILAEVNKVRLSVSVLNKKTGDFLGRADKIMAATGFNAFRSVRGSLRREAELFLAGGRG